MFGSKNLKKKIFLTFWFLVGWLILWLNSSSKPKFQLNWVTRRELGAILHSISWFVLSPSSQNMNNSINIGHIWPKIDCKCVFDTKSCYQNDLWSNKKISYFSIFSKFCDVRVKKFEKKNFLTFWFLVAWLILWLNSSSKPKFQLNRVTRRELGGDFTLYLLVRSVS